MGDYEAGRRGPRRGWWGDEIATGCWDWGSIAGAKESQRLLSEQWIAHPTYLTCPKLPPMPCHDSAWLRLYHSQNDRAFITTMGLNVETFNWILGASFNELWNLLPIPHTDVANSALPRAYHRSLDVVGALGPVLHILGSTMTETSLQQIFALVPATCSQYINFGLEILLKSLLNISEHQLRLEMNTPESRTFFMHYRWFPFP